tara:strand:- start:255 stop:626 length:372 start_codon:yes stop_codon:yes gene_type:complete
MSTHITKQNVKAAIKDDKAHMTYLKEDVNKDQKAGGKFKDINQTADEKHISKLAGDVKHDEKKEGVSRKSSSPLNESVIDKESISSTAGGYVSATDDAVAVNAETDANDPAKAIDFIKSITSR